MYDAKKLIDITNAIVKGYKEKYDRFLDERRTEWALLVERRFRSEPVGFDNPGPAERERLNLLRRIISDNEKYCRRDMDIPTLEFEHQMAQINKLIDLRAQAGLTEPHATILRQKGILLMLKGNYRDAQDELDRALSVNEHSEMLIAKRDNVTFLVDYVRCLYMQKKFDTAIAKADQTRRSATEISAEDEEVESTKYMAAPGLQFIPVAVHGYFAACDARINHDRWNMDDRLKREFTGLWSDSVTSYKVPQVWRTPTKIAVVSDSMWVSRMESYVDDIMEKLYVELAKGPTGRVVRLVRSKWGGFDIDYNKPVAAAAVMLFLMFSSVDENKTRSHTSDLSSVTIEMVLEETGVQADPEELKSSIVSHLPPDSWTTAGELEQYDVLASRFASTRSQIPLSPAVYSGSENSVYRI